MQGIFSTIKSTTSVVGLVPDNNIGAATASASSRTGSK